MIRVVALTIAGILNSALVLFGSYYVGDGVQAWLGQDSAVGSTSVQSRAISSPATVTPTPLPTIHFINVPDRVVAGEAFVVGWNIEGATADNMQLRVFYPQAGENAVEYARFFGEAHAPASFSEQVILKEPRGSRAAIEVWALVDGRVVTATHEVVIGA